MNSNNIKNQLRKTWSELRILHDTTGKNRLSLFLNFLYCYLRYGCLPRQYIFGQFYKMKHNERKNILTYRHILNFYSILNKKEDVHILENKSHFNEIFHDYIHREWILTNKHSPEEIELFINKHKKVIAKPLNEMEGNGIFIISNEDVKSKEIISRLCNQEIILEELIQQHPKMRFGVSSVNTIRVHSLMDSNGNVHIISCILRVGVGNSVVDNYCMGGAIYPLDNELGFVNGYGFNHKGQSVVIHPGTNIVMLGYSIPNWDILKREIVSAAGKIPSLRLVGWDVAILNDKIALIEGNHNPDYELFEFIGNGHMLKVFNNILKLK